MIFKSLKCRAVLPILAALILCGASIATSPQVQRAGDLIVEEIIIEPESPKPGDVVTITAVILNQGKKEIKQGFNVRFDVVFPVVGRAKVAVLKVSRGLKAGERKEVRLQWEVLELPIIRLRFTADAPFDQVQETREDNNWLEKVIQIPEEYIEQWGLDRIRAREAWKVTQGSPEVVVAVIDTGLDYAHPDLDANIWVNPGEIPGNHIDDDGNGYIDDIHGWDFVDDDPDSLSGSKIHWHGTAMAGVIAAEDDGFGVTGVAPRVKIMDLRVCDEEGACGFEEINAALKYAADNGADVVNMSLGLPFDIVENPPPALMMFANLEAALKAQEEALNYAASKGVIIVASAGNEATAVGYPARFTAAVAVSATNTADELAPYSNFGPEVELAAPGGDISEEELYAKLAEDFADLVPVLKTLIIAPFPTADGRPGYAWSAGTSPAAAFVSGVAALLLSIKPDLTPDELKEILARTADDLGAPGRDGRFGYGLVNVARAVNYLLELGPE
ncbi:TPA: hypothetical protein EYP12_00230 [Candidatus Bipolaricaulota bacterium]|nr:hypothetical protein [Candidatus Bipolaricaulota bacterium]